MVTTWGSSNAVVVDNMGLSLPSNPAFNSLLASLFPQLTNAYLVTCVVRYRQGESRHESCVFTQDITGRLGLESGIIKDLCTIRQPVVWHRDEPKFLSHLKSNRLRRRTGRERPPFIRFATHPNSRPRPPCGAERGRWRPGVLAPDPC